ncbi:hypothetical protein TrLO_g15506 [Triparma laevis f. longispina]|uniref:Uncharacterized protein n=1 Tax=Triparma laevis f. longispina TaxID=1714387 RepID=A0A9W7DSD5_9STRA|nr:hypothetical protein TrLO_g15506 [Triparma laevis f. longispina]
MFRYSLLLVLLIGLTLASAWINPTSLPPQPSSSTKSTTKSTLAKASATLGLASVLASGALSPPAALASLPSLQLPSTTIAEKVTRSGVYKDYDVDIVQTYDNADSTFKSKVETKSKKGKYTALLGVLVMGSFVIPMAQYFWYVKDDDSSDQFFAQKNAKTPPPPPVEEKKPFWKR